ncbi:prepilin peptidase [Solimonas soli]|uniref:prepilin peptidase n=1 Tax=Solimonas soli TaxID=413479 RepID=UPI000A02AF58|nr:A24 family peptidase [Solimonas soli]
MIVALLLSVWAAAIAGFDWWRRKVPNAALVLTLVPASLALVFQGQGLLGQRWQDSLLGMAIAFALALPGYLRRGLGAGDVKFAAVLGLLLGTARSFEMLLGAAILMGCVAGVMLLRGARGSAKFPAAPMLAAAFVVEVFCGPMLSL